MPENNKEQQYQPMTFDAIKIGWHHRRRFWSGPEAKLQSLETINYRTLKPERDGLFCERSSDQARTGSVTVENTKRSAIKALFATVVA